MKFEVWENIVSQSSYFKSRLDPVDIGGIEGGTKNLGKHLKLRDRDETWWEK